MLAGRNGHVVWEKGVCCSLVGRVWAWALIKPEDSTHSLSVGLGRGGGGCYLDVESHQGGRCGVFDLYFYTAR